MYSTQKLAPLASFCHDQAKFSVMYLYQEETTDESAQAQDATNVTGTSGSGGVTIDDDDIFILRPDSL